MKTAIDHSLKKVQKMIKVADYEEENAVRDMLADLRHYCDSKGIDFADEDRIAYNNYSEEAVEARNNS